MMRLACLILLLVLCVAAKPQGVSKEIEAKIQTFTATRKETKKEALQPPVIPTTATLEEVKVLIDEFLAKTDITSLNEELLQAEPDLFVEGDSIAPLTTTYGVTCTKCNLWPRGADGLYYVPYAFENKSDYTAVQLQKFDLVFRFFDSFTNIRFVERTIQQDYILIGRYGGCWCNLGLKGGPQQCSLDLSCETRKTITHELTHALGVGHEHQRADRGPHLNVYMDRVCTDYRSQLQTFNVDNYDLSLTPYDYASNMHYSTTAFGCPPASGVVTMEPTDPSKADMLNWDKMVPSSCDLYEINSLYPGTVKASSQKCEAHAWHDYCSPNQNCLDLYKDYEICNTFCLTLCDYYGPPNLFEKGYCKQKEYYELNTYYYPELEGDSRMEEDMTIFEFFKSIEGGGTSAPNSTLPATTPTPPATEPHPTDSEGNVIPYCDELDATTTPTPEQPRPTDSEGNVIPYCDELDATTTPTPQPTDGDATIPYCDELP